MSSAAPTRVAVLGATGSIGASALDVIARHPQRWRASVLAGGRRVPELVDLCLRHRPDHAVIADESGFDTLKAALHDAGLSTQAHAGMAAIEALAGSDACEVVVAAIVGAAGLNSTLAAARAGKRLLLANKESLVLAGELLMATAQAHGCDIIPIDSEHNAVFQCLPVDGSRSGLASITLTASGGPFRGRTRASLAEVTPAQAIAHPKWSMGPKISVDSATLMNKGLEVIEAHHLFALDADRIRVLVHPQSLVHSFVEFDDGSTLAQLGLPDMRTALAVGLAWPQRVASGVERLDLLQHGQLQFEAPDLETFPALRLSYEALRAGGIMPAALNALNEVAVSAFLQGQLRFLDVPALVEDGLAQVENRSADSLDVLREADAAARTSGERLLARYSSRVTS